MWTTRIALLLGLLGVLTLFVNVAAALGTTYSFVGGSLLVVGAVTYWIRERRYRTGSPKSAAFEVFVEFGPQGLVPREERLSKLFPKHSPDEIAEWIGEFKLVEAETWRLAEEGGNTARPDEEITRILKARFSFLQPSALNCATSLISFHVWHEGYALPKSEPELPII